MLLDGWEAEAGISEASLHRRVKLYRPWGKGALLLETLGRLATDFGEKEAYLVDYAKALWEAEDWADSKDWRETRWYVWCDKVSGSSRFLFQMYFAEALFSFNVVEAERRMGVCISDRRISGRLKREALRRGFPTDFSTPADSLRGAAYMRLGVLLSMESPKDAQAQVLLGFMQEQWGHSQAAYASYLRAKELGAHRFTMWKGLLRTAYACARYDTVIHFAQAAQAYYPYQAFLYVYLARAHSQKAAYTDAAEAYMQALAMGEASVTILGEYRQVLMVLGRTGRSFSRAIANRGFGTFRGALGGTLGNGGYFS